MEDHLLIEVVHAGDGVMGLKADAIDDYTAALDRDRRFVAARVNRGLARLELKQHAAALTDFDHALALDGPGDAALAAGRGLALEALGRHAEADSAFSNRGYLLWLNFAMRWDDPADDEDYIARTRNAVAGLAPWTGRGVYVNMLNFDEQDRVVEALGGAEKYAELARLKTRYDPANLFRMNANITPA